jgi:hypothetical protein
MRNHDPTWISFDPYHIITSVPGFGGGGGAIAAAGDVKPGI